MTSQHTSPCPSVSRAVIFLAVSVTPGLQTRNHNSCVWSGAGCVQVGPCCAGVCGEPVVVVVGDERRLTCWWGHHVQHGCVGGGQGPVVSGPCGQELCVGFLLRRVGHEPGRVVVGGG